MALAGSSSSAARICSVKFSQEFHHLSHASPLPVAVGPGVGISRHQRHSSRRLTDLDTTAVMRTFDIHVDRESVVFDRVCEWEPGPRTRFAR
jgi:hypothetical protein